MDGVRGEVSFVEGFFRGLVDCFFRGDPWVFCWRFRNLQKRVSNYLSARERTNRNFFSFFPCLSSAMTRTLFLIHSPLRNSNTG